MELIREQAAKMRESAQLIVSTMDQELLREDEDVQEKN